MTDVQPNHRYVGGVRLSSLTIQILTREAERRGVFLADLLGSLLTRTAEDNLIAAVMDDGR